MHTIENKIVQRTNPDTRVAQRLKQGFEEKMDNDLNVRAAFNELYEVVSTFNLTTLGVSEAAGIIHALREIDGVLKIIF